MKKVIVSLLLLMLNVSQLWAQEGVLEIAWDKERTQTVMNYLKREVLKIEKMSSAQQAQKYFEEQNKAFLLMLDKNCSEMPLDSKEGKRCRSIKAELAQKFQKKLSKLKIMTHKNERLARLIFVAQAKKELQQAQELMDIMVPMTRLVMGYEFENGGWHSATDFGWEDGWFFLIPAMAVDLVILAPTLIISVITGF